MKFDQLTEQEYFSPKNMQKIRLVPSVFFLFKKASYEVKASGLHLSFNIF